MRKMYGDAWFEWAYGQTISTGFKFPGAMKSGLSMNDSLCNFQAHATDLWVHQQGLNTEV